MQLSINQPERLDVVTFDYAPDILIPAKYPQVQQRAAGALPLSYEVFLHPQTNELFFILSSPENAKGSNMVMDVFYQIMRAHKQSSHPGARAAALAVQRDRGGENTNFGTLSMTGSAVVQARWTRTSLLSALLLGHTHCPADQKGGVGRQAVKRCSCVNTLVDIVRALKSSHPNESVTVLWVKEVHD